MAARKTREARDYFDQPTRETIDRERRRQFDIVSELRATLVENSRISRPAVAGAVSA